MRRRGQLRKYRRKIRHFGLGGIHRRIQRGVAGGVSNEEAPREDALLQGGVFRTPLQERTGASAMRRRGISGNPLFDSRANRGFP